MTDHFDLELKIGEPSQDGTFEGFASVFNETDLVGDQVAPGAFRKSLAAHKRSGRMPLMLWSHDLTAPIGKWTDIRETTEGLVVKGKLLLDVARAREVYAMLREKVVDGLSIGFRTAKSHRTKTGRLLQELDLAEISLVTLPCAPNARVRSVKSNAGQRRSPQKDPSMSLDLNILPDDDGTEAAAVPMPPEVLSRIEAIETKAAETTALATRLDRIETRLNRPAARVEVRDDPQAETKAFTAWCRKGWDGIGDIEKKILTAGTSGSPDPQGWQTVPEQFVAELERNLVEASPMRSLARVMQVGGTPVKLPKRVSNLAAAWVDETVEHDVSEPTYAQQEIAVHEAQVSTEVSNALLEDSAFNLASELAIDFGEAFGLLEGASFVSGSGIGEPQGFLTSLDFTNLSTGGVTADNIIDLFYAVPNRYAARGTWIMRREMQGTVRKLRSAVDGPYIWADSLIPGQPATLLGRPVVEFPDMEISGSPSPTVVAFGDWNRAFRIVDRIGLQVLRDPYSLARRSLVVFHARRRTGGALRDGAAVKGLFL